MVGSGKGRGRDRPAGAVGFYVVAVMSMVVSVDTSWRFFDHNLHITDVRERVVMFAVLEVALIACGYGMRANVGAHGRPGAPRLVAWVLCGMAGYMAWQLSGVAEGIARVTLGPVLGLVMLHLALGIEIRAGHARTTGWARVAHELRERLLSRLGLADDTRDALARTRDRAVTRAARLALAGRLVPWRAVRLTRALRAANVAHDEAAQHRLLAELATARHAGELAGLPLESPWRSPRLQPADTATATSTATSMATATSTAAASAMAAASDSAGRTEVRADRVGMSTPSRGTSGGKAGGKDKRVPRVSKADYLARARAELAAAAPDTTVTAGWVQRVVPDISRSMSYVVVAELTADPTTDPTAGTSADGAVAGGGVDGAESVRLVSVNGSAR
ncbi:MAG: hypothetical protein GEV28_40445 [Actinophytocola sp.]|uniref:hypothetical protein n=1 Tax=Actinophytocola sp. TaxID=1872138 RepID=UPI0013221E46|nr:hypothetical protein [Actinophytocola sp.]MPZ86308.1 hypothetical protein [Actinophytocola sp.]